MRSEGRKIRTAKVYLKSVHRVRVPQELFDEYELDKKIKLAKLNRSEKKTSDNFYIAPPQTHEVFERTV